MDTNKQHHKSRTAKAADVRFRRKALVESLSYTIKYENHRYVYVHLKAKIRDKESCITKFCQILHSTEIFFTRNKIESVCICL